MLLAINPGEVRQMETLKDKIKELEKEEIIKALKECGWVMAKAARKLGITERMIGYKIIKYGISAEFHAEFGKIKGVELTQPTMPIKRS